MKHILFFGFGFSAETLAKKLDRRDWKISGTSRSEDGARRISEMGFDGLEFDKLKSIASDVTHIVSSVPPDANGDPVLARFSKDLARPFSWIAYLSTTGVYGDHGGAWIDEDTPLTPNTERGERRLAAETAWSAVNPITQHFRLAGIYGPGRNQLLSVMDGTAKRVIKKGQFFSRIHVDDIAGILRASIEKPMPGRHYNVADDEPAPPQDVVKFAAEILDRPVPPDVAFEDAELSPMARSFYADSKRVSNGRVKTELGYQFLYPSYREGLHALLTSK